MLIIHQSLPKRPRWSEDQGQGYSISRSNENCNVIFVLGLDGTSIYIMGLDGMPPTEMNSCYIDIDLLLQFVMAFILVA